MDHEASPAALLARARDGSEEALERLFAAVGERLLTLIRLRLGRGLRERLESRDILQATLLKAFTRLPQLQAAETGPLMAWLARIAANEIRDQAAFHHRERRDAARAVPLEAVPGDLAGRLRSVTSRLVLDEEARRLEAALETLPAAQREVILLRRFEELGYGEIGARLGKSPDAARMLFARAMAALTRTMT